MTDFIAIFTDRGRAISLNYHAVMEISLDLNITRTKQILHGRQAELRYPMTIYEM